MNWSSGRAFLIVMALQAACGIAAIALGSGALTALGWLGLAAIPGVVATRTWGRRVIGGLVVVAALVAMVAGGTLPSGALALGCLVTGAVTTVLGPRWPTMGARYERARTETSAWQVLDAGGDPTLRGD